MVRPKCTPNHETDDSKDCFHLYVRNVVFLANPKRVDYRGNETDRESYPSESFNGSSFLSRREQTKRRNVEGNHFCRNELRHLSKVIIRL